MSEFNKPLDQEILEPVDVEKEVVSFDHETKMLSKKKVTERHHIRTTYTKAIESKMSCAPMTHSWHMIDRHTYEAGCHNCRKRLFLRPTEETIRDGKIVDRKSGEHIT